MTMKAVGSYASAIPFLLFLVTTISISFVGCININLLIIIGLISIMTGYLISVDKGGYWNTIFEYLGNRTSMTATMLWLLVGVYGAILKEGQIVEGLVWASYQFHITQAGFTLIAFFFSAIFAISTGSGFGTISAMSITLFPAGVALGANPALIGGAILSGAALGDSIAPVSDTAVIAATSQEYSDDDKGTADIGGTVKDRLPYVIVAAVLACGTFYFSAKWLNADVADTWADSSGNPLGLFMLIPTFVVIVLSLRRYNIFLSIFTGILLAVTIGLSFGLFSISKLISFDNNKVEGALVDGIGGMTNICILLMVVVSLSGLIIKSGCMDLITERMNGSAAKNSRRGDLTIFALSLIASILIASVNTIANICIAPFVNSIGKQRNIHPYRRSTILATVICTFPFFVPYGGCVLLLVQGVEASDCGVSLQTTDVFFTTFYSWILLLTIFVVCLTGYQSKKG